MKGVMRVCRVVGSGAWGLASRSQGLQFGLRDYNYEKLKSSRFNVWISKLRTHATVGIYGLIMTFGLVLGNPQISSKR